MKRRIRHILVVLILFTMISNYGIQVFASEVNVTAESKSIDDSEKRQVDELERKINEVEKRLEDKLGIEVYERELDISKDTYSKVLDGTRDNADKAIGTLNFVSIIISILIAILIGIGGFLLRKYSQVKKMEKEMKKALEESNSKLKNTEESLSEIQKNMNEALEASNNKLKSIEESFGIIQDDIKNQCKELSDRNAVALELNESLKVKIEMMTSFTLEMEEALKDIKKSEHGDVVNGVEKFSAVISEMNELTKDELDDNSAIISKNKNESEVKLEELMSDDFLEGGEQNGK